MTKTNVSNLGLAWDCGSFPSLSPFWRLLFGNGLYKKYKYGIYLCVSYRVRVTLRCNQRCKHNRCNSVNADKTQNKLNIVFILLSIFPFNIHTLCVQVVHFSWLNLNVIMASNKNLKCVFSTPHWPIWMIDPSVEPSESI